MVVVCSGGCVWWWLCVVVVVCGGGCVWWWLCVVVVVCGGGCVRDSYPIALALTC